jgi:hypothetical protein
MKRLLFLFLTGAILIWPCLSFAQDNRMGLSSENGYGGYCVFGPANQVYTVYLYIQDPVNPDFDNGGQQPVSWVNGFECRVWIDGGAILLGWEFPVNAIDAGLNGNTVVGFAEPVPVVDGRAILASLQIFLEFPGGSGLEPKASPLPCDGATAWVFMAPTRPTSSVEGMMAFLDADDPDDPLVGATPDWGYEENLVMLMEATPVSVDQQTWGGIKALYR